MRSKLQPQSNQQLAEALACEAEHWSPEQLLEQALHRLGHQVALATSLGPEDQVLTDMLCKISKDLLIFTIDTGRLPQQTHDLIEQTQQRYDIRIRVYVPDASQLEAIVNQYGPNLFYRSIQLRRLCCHIRKVEPLKRALSGLKGWICGLRTEQSISRAQVKPVQYDQTHDLVKICPLAYWSTQQLWQYIRDNRLPYNSLHDQGYTSIGCLPCTRPVLPGQEIRAGRWWWEAAEHKECGLHLEPDKET